MKNLKNIIPSKLLLNKITFRKILIQGLYGHVKPKKLPIFLAMCTTYKFSY